MSESLFKLSHHVESNKQFIATMAFVLFGLPMVEEDDPVAVSKLLTDSGYTVFLLDAGKDPMVRDAIKDAFDSSPDDFALAARMAASEVAHIYGGVHGIFTGTKGSAEKHVSLAIDKIRDMRNSREANGQPFRDDNRELSIFNDDNRTVGGGLPDELMDFLRSLDGNGVQDVKILQMTPDGVKEVGINEIEVPHKGSKKTN